MASQPDRASPPWSLRLIDALHAADARATMLANTMTQDQLNWARPGEWSVGQCLDHLLAANNVYLPPIADALTGCPAAPVEDITPGWFGRWFIRNYIEPSATTRRARAPKKITPGVGVDASILNRFLASNAQARDLVHAGRNCDVNRIRFVNPFAPLIRFTVGTGFEILTRHQDRHLLQAERVKASPDFPQR